MEFKEKFADRFGQTFSVFSNNCKGVILPFFLYNLLGVFISSLFLNYLFSYIGGYNSETSIGFMGLFTDTNFVIYFSVGIILFLAFIFIGAIVNFGVLKNIKDIINGKEYSILDNFYYSLSRILDILKVYWFIFAYVALIPAIIFIIGGLLLNIGLVQSIGEMKIVGGFLMGLGAIAFMVFAIYRGIKATFPLYKAIDSDDFSKNGFNYSINLTDGRWFRVLGNILLVGLIIGLIAGLISVLINIVIGITGYNLVDFESIETFEDFLAIATNYSMPYEIFSGVINSLINSITAGILLVFVYIFFKRLEKEGVISENSEEKL